MDADSTKENAFKVQWLPFNFKANQPMIILAKWIVVLFGVFIIYVGLLIFLLLKKQELR
jgi:hypothetical protein